MCGKPGKQKMTTPILDFIRQYRDSSPVRMHMPGHKGIPLLGAEPMDITEIDGADELFCPHGVIAESEENASRLFGCPTWYSAGGSTLCIQTMTAILCQVAVNRGQKPKILAGRNAHRSFVYAAALLGFEIVWLWEEGPILSCRISPEKLKEAIARHRPTAVYLTDPDYLGNRVDLAGLARVCHRAGVLLAVDNAHGAYLRFLPESSHPMDLGADVCCDSAHKTLPVLTGGAYLHLTTAVCEQLQQPVWETMQLFASSSPSYLILASLDAVNRQLCREYPQKLRECLVRVKNLKEILIRQGFRIFGDEPMKITLCAKEYGYTGTELSAVLQKNGIVPEFSDPDFLTLMPSPENGKEDFSALQSCLNAVPCRAKISSVPPAFSLPRRGLSVRSARFSKQERLPVRKAVGRICADVSVSCPPAVLPVIPGEMVEESTVSLLEYYGISHIRVVAAPFEK